MNLQKGLNFNLTNIQKIVEFSANKNMIYVGWGTQDYYEREKAPYLTKLDCLIDSNVEFQGGKIDGLSIYSPEHLKGYDVEKVIVIIFSSFFRDIEGQLKELGVTKYMCPISDEQFKQASKFMVQASGSVPSVDLGDHKDVGVVIQGLLDPNLTIPLITRFRHMHPSCKIILSTWDTTEPEHIETVRSFVDKILLLPDVSNPGDRNRNRQSFSTFEGIRVAKMLGCKFIFKIRSDVWVCRDDILDFLKNIWKQYPSPANIKATGRIILAQSYSRVFVPFHPGDMIMFGHVDDMTCFWDMSHDSNLRPDREASNLWDYCVRGFAPETEYGYSYCQRTSQIMPECFAESLRWFCSHFVVVDDIDFETFWYKLSFSQTFPLAAHLYNHKTWRAIAVESKANIVAEILNPKDTTVEEYYAGLRFKPSQPCLLDMILGNVDN